MVMNVPSQQNKSKAIGAGTALGVIGMSAYHLPVTKNRFVRTAYNVQKGLTEDIIERLNDSADEVAKNKVTPETKVFLNEHGVAETLDAISNKCIELKKSITDKNAVKTLKEYFANNFKDFKKSEELADVISSKALSRIRWTNLGWGAFIGFILGNALVGGRSSQSNPPAGM